MVEQNTIKLEQNTPHIQSGLSKLLSKYDEIFQEGLETLKGYKAKIEVNPEATPLFCKARTLSYSMRDKVEEELNQLVTDKAVDYSDWAAPIVAVVKSDQKSVHVCGDFRMTVNPVSKPNRYPIPKVEDLFATLERGKSFTKLDLSQAYQQLKLNTELRKYVVINTHKGLFTTLACPMASRQPLASFRKPWKVSCRALIFPTSPCILTTF